MDHVEESLEMPSRNDAEKAKAESSEDNLTSDHILNEIGGFGVYQILVGVASGIALLLSSLNFFNFVYSADVPEHRCWIPECESFNTSDFHADWTRFAIPWKNGALDSCSRYAYIPSDGDNTCSERNFDQSQTISCGGYIAKNYEERLINHLNLFCTDYGRNTPLIGTASTMGRAAGVIFSGIVSDKLGRLNTFVGCLMLSSIFGCLQTLPVPFMSFELYATFEFFIAFALSGVLGAACVFNMEWASANRRAYLNGLALLLDGIHPAFIALAAWYFADSFVEFKLCLALSGLIVLIFYFALNEPPQWLLARQKYSRLIKSITNAGRMNGRLPSTKLIELIQCQSAHTTKIGDSEHRDNHGHQVTIRDLLTEKVLLIRLAVLSLVFLCKAIAYFGMVLISSKVHDNKYLSFALIGFSEVPGALFALTILNRVGRRTIGGIPMIVYGALLLASTQLSTEQRTIKVVLMCISRAALQVSSIGFCTYATELWPTAVRNRAYNTASLFGRFGAILASLSVMLVEYHAQLPIILYASAAIISAILLYAFLPETLHCKKLPDTIDEAVAIGKKK